MSTHSIASFDRDTPPPPDRKPPFDLCFFAMADSFVRMRGGENGLYGVARQMTYRCGLCGGPVTENDLQAHFDEHREGLHL